MLNKFETTLTKLSSYIYNRDSNTLCCMHSRHMYLKSQCMCERSDVVKTLLNNDSILYSGVM